MSSVPVARMAVAVVIGTLAVAGSNACGSRAPRGGDTSEASRTIEEVLAAHTDSLMALPGVVGTAIGLCDRTPCIRVFLFDSSATVRRRIPAQLEGYRVSAEVTGPFRARESAPGRPPP